LHVLRAAMGRGVAMSDKPYNYLVGEVVECIDNSGAAAALKIGAHYTIANIVGELCYFSDVRGGWCSSRFRSVTNHGPWQEGQLLLCVDANDLKRPSYREFIACGRVYRFLSYDGVNHIMLADDPTGDGGWLIKRFVPLWGIVLTRKEQHE